MSSRERCHQPGFGRKWEERSHGHQMAGGRRGGRGEGEFGFGPRGHHGRGGGGNDWPPFGGRGRRFGRGPRVGRGDVRAAVLTLLDENPSNGYQLIQQIEERSGGVWRPSPGSVYPALQLLQDEGLVTTQESDGGRRFHLTDAGRTYVEEHRRDLTAAWESVAGTVDDSAVEMRNLFFQVGAALMQVVQAGTDGQIAEARQLLTGTRRQLYRILAADEGDGEQTS